jgi:hypothetical protein
VRLGIHDPFDWWICLIEIPEIIPSYDCNGLQGKMKMIAQNKEDLAKALAQANEDQAEVESIDLSCLNRILNYSPEDMTVTVRRE